MNISARKKLEKKQTIATELERIQQENEVLRFHIAKLTQEKEAITLELQEAREKLTISSFHNARRRQELESELEHVTTAKDAVKEELLKQNQEMLLQFKKMSKECDISNAIHEERINTKLPVTY